MVMTLQVELESRTRLVHRPGQPLRCSDGDQIHRMSDSTCVELLIASQMSGLN